MVRFLVERAWHSVDTSNKEGRTPLMWACQNGDLGTVGSPWCTRGWCLARALQLLNFLLFLAVIWALCGIVGVLGISSSARPAANTRPTPRPWTLSRSRCCGGRTRACSRSVLVRRRASRL